VKSKKKMAYIQQTGGQILITSPFDDALKKELMSGTKSRRWIQEKKVWSVDIEEQPKAMDIVSRFFQVVEDKRPDETPASTSRLNAEPIEATSGTKIDSVLRPGIKGLKIWTDGACRGNPGPGGYGVVIEYEGHKRELWGGFRLTTNNRMELMGAIKALEAIPEKCEAIIYSDSTYLVNSMTIGWVKRWRSKDWINKGNKKVPNADLWERMLQLCAQRKVKFNWVKGHNSNIENERCDRLAESAAQKPDLPDDEGYTNVGKSL